MRFSFELLAAHGCPCPYCGQTMRVPRGRRLATPTPPNLPTRDHVIPRSRMPGQGTLIVCHQCNMDKANRTLPEWEQHLSAFGDRRAAVLRALMDRERHRRSSEVL